MNQKELRRLSRGDLLEMMLSLSKENERLRKELHQANRKLEDRTIAVEQSGSLAEAALNLNGVFQAAQAACDQYSLSIHSQADALLAQAQEQLADTDARCSKMLIQANKQAKQIVFQARAQAKKILEEGQRKLAAREEMYSWIAELMENGEEA